MAEQITFRGVVIWDTDVDGAGWAWKPGGMIEGVVEVKSDVGTGYWIKRAGKEAAVHTLEIHWHTTTPKTLADAIEGLANHQSGVLVVPGWGSYAKCRLSGMEKWDPQRSDDATGYLLSNVLTFTQYP